MNPLPATQPPLGPVLLSLIERHGSPEERRMIRGCSDELLAFFAHPDAIRFAARGSLDIGLENRLVLKFNLLGQAKGSPWSLIHDWACRMPVFQEIADTVIHHRLRCHAGIRLSAQGIEYELYPYESADQILQNGIFADFHPEKSGLPLAPHCYGFSSTGALSAYAETADIHLAELEQAAGFRLPAQGLKINALFNSRCNPDGNWRTDKAGIEFTPFPSHLLNAVLGNFNLHFAYLLHRGGTRKYGVVGIHGTRQVLYTTMFPKLPAPAERPDNAEGAVSGTPATRTHSTG